MLNRKVRSLKVSPEPSQEPVRPFGVGQRWLMKTSKGWDVVKLSIVVG
jgi:hypothetical protein